MNYVKAIVAALATAGSTFGALSANPGTPVWLGLTAAVGAGLGTFAATYQTPPGPGIKTPTMPGVTSGQNSQRPVG